MSQTVRFTEENHPELMNVPLKGKMLREFVQFVRDSTDIQQSQVPKNAPTMQIQGLTQINDIIKKICDAITSKMSSDSAMEFGIDLKDLANIIKRVTQQNPDEVNVQEAYTVLFSSTPPRGFRYKVKS